MGSNPSAATIEKLLREHHITLAGTPREQFYRKASTAEATLEANEYKFTGGEKQVFIKERERGYIVGEQFGGSALAQNPVGELLSKLTDNLVHAKSETTKQSTNPQTGQGNTENERAGTSVPVANTIIEALSSFINSYGIRALEVIGGAALILFGLFTIAKKGDVSMPNVVPVPV